MKYWLHPKINWKVFKKLANLVPDSGPTPLHGDKMLYDMLQDRSINIYIDTKQPTDPMCITTNPIPNKATIIKTS